MNKVEKNSIFGRIDRTPFCLIAWQIRTIPRPTRTTIFIYRRYLQKELMNAPLWYDSFRRHHSSFNSIKSMIVKGYIKNDYTLLESIDIPEKVGVEEVRHIGKVLEQAFCLILEIHPSLAICDYHHRINKRIQARYHQQPANLFTNRNGNRHRWRYFYKIYIYFDGR